MTLKGRIIKGIGGFYYVDAAGVLYETRARGLFRKTGITPLVGDIAEIDVISEEEHTAYLTEIDERTSCLTRPAVANVDQVLVIFACTNPPANTGLLDRFLLNMEKQEIETCIVFSKIDLLEDAPDELDKLCGIYEKTGYKVIRLSNKSEEGLDAIKDFIRGKKTVLSGPSGVGKSSLINNLVPGFDAETGDISKKLGKGKNTTRHTEFISVPGEADTFIIDTPGYSSIELLIDDENDVKYYVREFGGFNEQCRFAGCVHVAEPGCMIKDRVENGEISEQRYQSYVDIYNEIKNRRKW
ncbi:MAG: ribosome small subunit-dependent GTPase A [Eubacterium sp.]|nr:ribosome small subunit-dependent GTPase A [Eubacterium sp.]